MSFCVEQLSVNLRNDRAVQSISKKRKNVSGYWLGSHEIWPFVNEVKEEVVDDYPINILWNPFHCLLTNLLLLPLLQWQSFCSQVLFHIHLLHNSHIKCSISRLFPVVVVNKSTYQSLKRAHNIMRKFKTLHILPR